MARHEQDPFFEAIGKRIQALREAKGENQDQLATYMDVPRATVAKWENGWQNFKSKEIVRIADYFGVTTDYLLRGVSAKSEEAIDFFAATGLTDAAIQSLADEKNVSDMLFDNGRIPLANELLADKRFFVLLEKFAHFRAEWKALQKERKAAKRHGASTPQNQDAGQEDSADDLSLEDRAAFLKWKYMQSVEQYTMEKLEE